MVDGLWTPLRISIVDIISGPFNSVIVEPDAGSIPFAFASRAEITMTARSSSHVTHPRIKSEMG